MTQNNQLASPHLRLLHRNIILIIISVSVIPLILVSSTIYYQFRNSYREKVYVHLRELVQSHTENIDSFLQEKLGDIRFLAGSCGLDQLRNESFLQNQLTELKQYFGDDFVDLGVINAKGKQITYVGPFKLSRAEYSDAEWFRQAINREYFISDVFLGLRGLPHLIVAVRNTSEGVTWILRATINFVAFNTLVGNIRLGRTGFAFILNKKGQLQTTPITKPSMDIIPSKAIYTELLNTPASSPSKVRIAVKADTAGHKNIYVAAFLKKGDWLLVYQQRVADAVAELGDTFVITAIMIFLGGCPRID